MGSSKGVLYVTLWAFCLFAMNLGMESMGPGRYRATMAVRSSIEVGFMLTQTPVMPADSIWNTPWVFPSASMV